MKIFGVGILLGVLFATGGIGSTLAVQSWRHWTEDHDPGWNKRGFIGCRDGHLWLSNMDIGPLPENMPHALINADGIDHPIRPGSATRETAVSPTAPAPRTVMPAASVAECVTAPVEPVVRNALGLASPSYHSYIRMSVMFITLTYRGLNPV